MLNQVVSKVKSTLYKVKQAGGWQWGGREGGKNVLDRPFNPTHPGRQDIEKSYILLKITGGSLSV
jgi:hypothetical protein